MWTVVLAFGLACGDAASVKPAPESARTPAGSPASGIEGQAIVRPVRSVAPRGAANHAPYQAKISVLDTAGREVAVVESDAAGNFRLPLPPGSYVLRPQSVALYPRASEQKVVVKRGKLTRVEIVYDSGRR